MGAKFSAGLLPWRPGPEVFLVHMAGPYWAHKEDGAWSVAKGEYDPAVEDPREVAAREFAEEVGMPAPVGQWLDLGVIRMPSGKRVRTYAVATEADLHFVSSNLFELEWPPGSGQVQQFPETDRAQWWDLTRARTKLVAGQLPILDLLEAALKEAPG